MNMVITLLVMFFFGRRRPIVSGSFRAQMRPQYARACPSRNLTIFVWILIEPVSPWCDIRHEREV
jgi:hypothetical protein